MWSVVQPLDTLIYYASLIASPAPFPLVLLSQDFQTSEQIRTATITIKKYHKLIFGMLFSSFSREFHLKIHALGVWKIHPFGVRNSQMIAFLDIKMSPKSGWFHILQTEVSEPGGDHFHLPNIQETF